MPQNRPPSELLKRITQAQGDFLARYAVQCLIEHRQVTARLADDVQRVNPAADSFHGDCVDNNPDTRNPQPATRN